jgi:hypothetical protein
VTRRNTCPLTSEYTGHTPSHCARLPAPPRRTPTPPAPASPWVTPF